MNKRLRNQGFTLIELMIVVAIVGILAAIAFPSYQDSLNKGRRSDGQAALLQLQSVMERHMFDNNQYPSKLSDLSIYSSDSTESPEGHYDVSIKNPTAACPVTNCYQLLATAKGVQTGDGDLELHSDGTKVGNWGN